MSNGNSSFKGVSRYVFTSNNIQTHRLSVSDMTNLTSVTVTDGMTIEGNTSHGPSTATLGFYGKTAVARPAAIANASDAGTVILRLNDLLAAVRALGLIATA